MARLSQWMIPMAAAGAMFAQQSGAPIKQEIEKEIRSRVTAAAVGGVISGNHTFEFIAGEMVGGQTVKGQPYSAEAVSETVQMLADGNRIVRKSSSMIYRDGEGRERREHSLGGNAQTVFISDPVNKVNWSLNPDKKTALKMPRPELRVLKSTSPAGSGTSVVTSHESTAVIEIKREGQEDVLIHSATPGTPMPTVMPFIATTGPVMVEGHRLDRKNVKTEPLGKQTIEGVLAEGTRTTVTIAAGEIGNERPIETVSERWYSPELQAVVMTRRSDPRTGETTYKLTRVNRTEPLKSLFEIPSDYSVTEPPARMRLLDKEMREKIEKDLKQLPERQREIF
jgi:hypothetical protein